MLRALWVRFRIWVHGVWAQVSGFAGLGCRFWGVPKPPKVSITCPRRSVEAAAVPQQPWPQPNFADKATWEFPKIGDPNIVPKQ